METLKEEEHAIWMKVEKDLKFDAEHIADTKDVEHQRAHFATLSENMYALIKLANPIEKIYYQNCPMYNDGKGANWLSKESVIKSPYYGNKMLSQLGHVMAIRSENQSLFSLGIFSNKPLIGAVLIAILLQFVITYTPFLQPIFQIEALTLNEFFIVGAASSLVFFAVEIEKVISRRSRRN